MQVFCHKNKSQRVFCSCSNLCREKPESVPCAFHSASGLLLSMHPGCWVCFSGCVFFGGGHLLISISPSFQRGQNYDQEINGTNGTRTASKTENRKKNIMCGIVEPIYRSLKLHRNCTFSSVTERNWDKHTYGKQYYQNLQKP